MNDGHRLRYPRSARVRRGPEIRALLREGSRRRSGPLEAVRRPSTSRKARAAIIIPLHGHTVVERNRLKRRVREFLRTEWLPVARRASPEPELLVRARPGAYELSADQLRAALFDCTRGEG